MSKIALPIAELKPALTGLSKVLSKRTTLPVLNHLKIERTKDGWIALTATDLDTFATVRLEQPVEGPSIALLVPHEDLQKIVKSCGKDDTLHIEGDEKEVTITYPVGQQPVETKVTTLPVAEFPEIPRIKGEAVPVPNALRSSLHEAFECASTDETRMILNGAYVDVSDKKCHHVVGTDGRHLYSSNSFNLPLNESVIIPTHRFLGWKEFNADGEWQLKLGEKAQKDETTLLQITSRRWRFITRQHEGNYPNWRQVIPSEFAMTLSFADTDLAALIKTVERMPEHDQLNHTLGIEAKEGAVHLLCKTSADQPWSRVLVKDAKITGKDITILLNRHYFIKALSFGLHQLDLIDVMSPMRFSHEGRQIIVMPVRPESATTASKPQPAPSQSSQAESPQPAAPTDAAKPERTTMPRRSNPPAASPATQPGTTDSSSETSPLDKALTQIETVKGSYRDAIKGLNELTDTLKQVQRDQKTTEKEIQSVRTTLTKLQGLKL